MRSEVVTGALKYVPNRYQLTHLAAKAIRKLHKPNARVADTTNEVFLRFGRSNPMGLEPETVIRRKTALRRAS